MQTTDNSHQSLSRRGFLVSGLMAAIGWASRPNPSLARVSISPGKKASTENVLVILFLRGGADGLNMVAPYAEDAYYRYRPTLNVSAPNDKTKAAASRLLDLDGFFGLNPLLAPLLPAYRKGMMAVVHACGSQDQTRSHFEAMSAMERGLASGGAGTSSGWLARHLACGGERDQSPLRAVSFSSVMPDSLKGATGAVALPDITGFRLNLPEAIPQGGENEIRQALAGLYDSPKDAAARAGRETLAVLETLNRLKPDQYRPGGGAVYPSSELGTAFRQVAFLIRANIGLEVACLEKGGWDSHIAQNNLLPAHLADIGQAVGAFATDLGSEISRVTVIVITEFGRRLYENSGLGTDHGRGSVMFVLGGGINGGQVYARWPGLEPARLEPPGDLRVTTDYRDILAEIILKRQQNRQLADVFPGYNAGFRGIAQG
ncbi:MAG: DUF1501 domain-containing protein [Armatimonadetes bacterium]|nr:DUF1501 domain-containing protein [Armatimonadota bacterium]